MKTYNKIIFTDDKKKEEWDSLDAQVKRSVEHHLKEYADRMTLEHTVDMLVQICQDLIERVEKLER